MSDLTKLAEDIKELKFDQEILDKLFNQFYELARKHNIKKGTRVGKAIQMNNAEWTLLEDAFISHLAHELKIKSVFDDHPEDLECY